MECLVEFMVTLGTGCLEYVFSSRYTALQFFYGIHRNRSNKKQGGLSPCFLYMFSSLLQILREFALLCMEWKRRWFMFKVEHVVPVPFMGLVHTYHHDVLDHVTFCKFMDAAVEKDACSNRGGATALLFLAPLCDG